MADIAHHIRMKPKVDIWTVAALVLAGLLLLRGVKNSGRSPDTVSPLKTSDRDDRKKLRITRRACSTCILHSKNSFEIRGQVCNSEIDDLSAAAVSCTAENTRPETISGSRQMASK